MSHDLKAILAAGLLALAPSAGAVAGPAQDGEAALQQGDYAAALRSFRPLAEQGDAQAQYELGRMYDAGQGVARNYPLAAAWIGKSAAQGNAKAQFLLALMYARGQGVTQNDKRGRYWLAKAQAADPAHRDTLRAIYAANLASAHRGDADTLAKQSFAAIRSLAEQGNAQAQFEVGRRLMQGNGAARDYGQAAIWLRKAAEQGMAQAQSSLGGLYELGLGVKQSYAEAHAWFLKAAEQGYAPAQVNLADLYEYGYGVAKDQAQVDYWRAKAAEHPAPPTVALAPAKPGP